MPMPPPADELLRLRIKQYIAAGMNFALGSRMFNVPVSTFKNQVMIAKQRWPNVLEEAERKLEHRGMVWTLPQLIERPIVDGCAIVGGDLHAWPGEAPIMWQAFCAVAKKIKPQLIVLNGDLLDGARVSRHGALLGTAAPKVDAEIDALTDWLAMLPKGGQRVWTIGNHDQRVNTYLQANAPELDTYVGRLEDRFPQWDFCYGVAVGNVEIRHRFRGGIHAAWNNALHAGISMVTGHTHQLQMTAVRNRNGTHWGIEGGMLGDPKSRAFEYTEGAPSRAQEGFVVLTFDEEGALLPPELCEMVRGRPIFRGRPVF